MNEANQLPYLYLSPDIPLGVLGKVSALFMSRSSIEGEWRASLDEYKHPTILR